MDAFTPAQTTELVARIGSKKAQMNYVKLFFNACVGGALLGFGSALALSTEAAPWFATNAPGLLRTIGAFVFPAGLTMIILTGTDLATSNFLVCYRSSQPQHRNTDASLVHAGSVIDAPDNCS